MKPALVLLPGLLCDAALWRHQINALHHDFHVIVPKLTGAVTVAELARHVLEVVPDDFAMVGLSMGGYIAMEVMRQAPERVKKLALLNTTARPDTQEQRARRRGLIELSRKGDFKGVTPRLLPLLIAQSRLEDAALKQVIFDMASRVGIEGFIRQQQAILQRPDSRPSLATIRAATLIICGAQDALTPPDHAEEMAALVMGSQLHILSDCGHLSPLERPEEISVLLRDWLKV